MPNYYFRRMYSVEGSFIDLKHAINSIAFKRQPFISALCRAEM